MLWYNTLLITGFVLLAALVLALGLRLLTAFMWRHAAPASRRRVTRWATAFPFLLVLYSLVFSSMVLWIDELQGFGFGELWRLPLGDGYDLTWMEWSSTTLDRPFATNVYGISRMARVDSIFVATVGCPNDAFADACAGHDSLYLAISLPSRAEHTFIDSTALRQHLATWSSPLPPLQAAPSFYAAETATRSWIVLVLYGLGLLIGVAWFIRLFRVKAPSSPAPRRSAY